MTMRGRRGPPRFMMVAEGRQAGAGMRPDRHTELPGRWLAAAAAWVAWACNGHSAGRSTCSPGRLGTRGAWAWGSSMGPRWRGFSLSSAATSSAGPEPPPRSGQPGGSKSRRHSAALSRRTGGLHKAR